MKTTTTTLCSLLFVATLIVSGCGTADTPPPSTPIAFDDLAVDPRIGFTGPVPSRSVTRGFDTALRDIRAGRLTEAERRLSGIAERNPEYLPAQTALAAVALREANPDRAQSLIDRVLERQPDFLAARILEAEIAGARDDLERAFTLYRDLIGREDFPATSRPRHAHFQQRWFERLFNQAVGERDIERSIALLRDSLTVMPEARAARQLLVDKLIETRKFDDARRQVQPLMDPSQPSPPEVEAALAEIDVGKGRYQEAIERLEPLARDDPGRYAARLEAVKQRWSESNMPPRYHNALASPSITRAELAVLMYWKVPFVRFAQNLTQPPIAIDIAEVEGREEFVRALALRLYQVDPVTRAAVPYRTVGSAGFLRLAGRLLTLRGIPPCAEGAQDDNDLAQAVKMLRACGAPLGSWNASSDMTVSGKRAGEVLDAIAAATTTRTQ
ncbi:MAG TPA: tetratricopeptide repeat protein [Thermoanaerobaculia bacterium]|nr:tetratricopeptide repeat protein [Thermoanaerobaculia bacterium]